MATGLFRPTYPPPGMTRKAAKAAGLLRESEVWWIRYRHKHRTVRESARTTRYEDAKKLLNERRRTADRHEAINPRANRVTFTEMAERLRADYRVNGKHLPTLGSRLGRLEPVFGARRMADIGLHDIARYKDERLAAKATRRPTAPSTGSSRCWREPSPTGRRWGS
jgi:hypothetical protein